METGTNSISEQVRKSAVAQALGGEINLEGTIVAPESVNYGGRQAAMETAAEEPPVVEEVTEIAGENKPAKEEVVPGVETNTTENKAKEVKAANEAIETVTPKGPAEPIVNNSKPPVESLNELIRERTGDKYKTIDDIQSDLENYERLKNEPKIEFASPQVAKINELVKQGVDLDKWLQAQALDYGKMSDFEVAKIMAKKEYPDFTNEEIEEWVKDTYPIDTDRYTEDEVRRGNLRLKADAVKARKELNKEKEEQSLPKTAGLTEQQVEFQKRQEQIQKAWADTVEKDVNGYEKEVFKVGDLNVEYVVSMEDRDKLKKNMSNLGNYWQRYLDEKGNADLSRFKRDMLWIENQDKILDAVAKEAIAKGAENVVKEVKNITMTPSGTNAPSSVQSQKAKTVEEQVASFAHKYV